MKKIYSLVLPIFVGFLFIITPIRAQECFEVIKTPLGSTVNTWDWRGTLYDFYLKLAPPSNSSYLQLSEVSPFHSLSYSIQPNTFHLAFHPNENNDYEPSEGWELLYKNFGTQQVPVFNPSFALYNRYDSKVRIFIWANTTNVFQNATITVNQKTLGFQKNSSVLEHVNTPMNALDKFNKGVKISTSNVYTTQNGTWLFFEFGAAFDPCTCLHSTAIEITPQLLGNITLDLTLTGTGVTNQIITPSSTMTASDNGFLATFGLLAGALKQGYKGYNNINKFTNDTEKFINAIGMIGAPTPTPGVPGTPTPAIKPPFKFPSFLKQAPGYIGFAAGIIEYFAAKGKPDPNAVKPLNFHSSYSFSGTGQASYNAVNGPALVYTPGSIQNIPGLPPSNKPTYDNILGVINVLETPKIKKSQSIINVLSGGYGYQVTAETKYIAEPIKYAFNSNSGLTLKSEDIRVALFFDGASGPISDDLIQVTPTVWRTPFMPLGALDDYTIRIKHVYGGSAYGTPTDKVIFNGKITLEFVNVFNFNKPEETMFAARYFTEIVPSSLASDFPANPYLGIVENLEIRDPANNTQYVAWNSITIIDGANLLPSENTNFYSDQVFISTNTPSALQPFMNGTSLDFGLYNPPPNFNPKFYQGINGAYASVQLVPAQTAAETKNFCVQKYKPDALIEDDPDLIDRIEGEEIASNLIVTINPTLFKESFNIMVETGSSGKMSIRLTDLGGNIVHDDTQYIEDKGKWYITVTRPNLPAGFYIALY